MDVFRVFVITQSHETRMAEMVCGSPVGELNFGDELWFYPPVFFVASAVSASPRHAVFGSGRMSNGHLFVSSGCSRSKICFLSEGVKPFLILGIKMSWSR
jgi:hypothetical protein